MYKVWVSDAIIVVFGSYMKTVIGRVRVSAILPSMEVLLRDLRFVICNVE